MHRDRSPPAVPEQIHHASRFVGSHQLAGDPVDGLVGQTLDHALELLEILPSIQNLNHLAHRGPPGIEHLRDIPSLAFRYPCKATSMGCIWSNPSALSRRFSRTE